MHKLHIAADDSAAWMKDEVAAAELFAFASDGKVVGRFRLRPLLDGDPFDYFVGPFVHVGAATDAFEHYLRGVSAITGRLVIQPEVGTGPAPVTPSIPNYRRLTGKPINPEFVGRLLLKIQECLDAGDEAMSNALRFEMDYPGEKFDERPSSHYGQAIDLELGGKRPVEAAQQFLQRLEAEAAPSLNGASRSGFLVDEVPSTAGELLIPDPTPEQRALADNKIFELPLMSRNTSLRPLRVKAGGVGGGIVSPVDDRGQRVEAKPAIDWSGLPVRVIEQRLSDEQAILRADLVRRRFAHH